MSKTQMYVGVNITANELTEQLFVDDKLPKNYELRTYEKEGFNRMLRMTKPNILETRNINGVCDFNSYLQKESAEDAKVVTVIKRKFANKP
jgi:hypothetical protein